MAIRKPTKLYHVPTNASNRYKSRKTRCIILDKGKLNGEDIVQLGVVYATHVNGVEIDPPISSGKAVIDPIAGVVRHRDGKFWTFKNQLEPVKYGN